MSRSEVWPGSQIGAGVLIATIAVVALAVHFTALGVFFAVDDFGAFSNASIWPLPPPAELVAHRFLSQPALFYLHRTLFGAAPLPYHLSLLVLHCVNAWLLFRCLDSHAVGATPQTARLAALVFVAHPAAHTPLAWISAGFNEVPTVTGMLVALLLFLNFVEGGRWRHLLLAVTVSSVALGFNQHAVFGWTYLLALGAVVSWQGETHHVRRLRARRVAVGALFPVLMGVWFWQAVLPKMFLRFGEPYSPDWSWGALATAALRLGAQTLNPLPVARVEIGAQPAINLPSGLDPTSLAGLTWQLAVVVLILGVSLRRARVTGSLGAWMGWCAAGLGSVVWATPLSGHLMDYYVYPSLPAAAVVISGSLAPWLDTISARVVAASSRRALAATLVAALAVGSAHLYASNAVVEQAQRARALVDGLASRPGQPARICFVPPSEVAALESVGGVALFMASYRRGYSTAPTGHFLSPSEPHGCGRATEDTWLASFERTPAGTWQVVWLDRYTSTHAATHEVLEPGTFIRQQFEIGSAAAAILEVPLEWRGRDCVVRYRLMHLDHHGPSDVGSGRLVCDPSWNHHAMGIPIPLPRFAGGRYELELSVPAPAGDGTVLVPITSAFITPHPALTREGATHSPLDSGSRVLAYRLRLAVGIE